MKIATLENGTRDGQLLILSEDGTTGRKAAAGSLIAALDGTGFDATGEAEAFDAAQCASPLPRAVQFLDASAYVNHVELVRKARKAEMPERFWTDPLMYQGASYFNGPTAPILGDPAWGIDFEAEIAVITGDVSMGASPEEAAGAIRFVMLLNDISLRNLIPDELSKGFGFVQSKPVNSCAPLAVTPEALPGWDGRKLNGIFRIDLNGAPFGRVEAGQDMTFDFGQLIAHAAKTRHLPAGTVIGSGTVSNKDADGGPGRPVADGGRGYACIAEQRMIETIQDGAPKTPFLQPGDRVEIWMEDENGQSIFGRIDQTVQAVGD
ncbi:MAG: fumarylacetoacetate hydrolase family protein [Rhodobacteraceae bacterium]|nr:fumarylacetoacetate hydrolase family protein [Paracoccaceae bacterium]